MTSEDIHSRMADEVQSEIVTLEAQQEEIAAQLAQLKPVHEYHAARATKAVQPNPRRPKSTTIEVASHHSGEQPRFATMRNIEAAETILRENGQPMKTGDIARALVAGGIPQKDVKKVAVSLFTSMSRKPDIFEKAGSGLWKLKNMKS